MGKTAEYLLSAYSFVSTMPLDELMDVGNMSKNGNPIPSFEEDILIEICNEAMQIFEKENNVLEIEGDLIIVGDIHGSFHDLLRILKFIEDNKSKVLFLGDYVDRGNFSLECISLLFALKVAHPDTYFLIRGNHEFDSVCSIYGFKDEILNYYNPKKISLRNRRYSSNPKITKAQSLLAFDGDKKRQQDDGYYSTHNDMNCYKYTEKLYEAFLDAFSYLPIAAIANGTTFCIHGGLSPNLENIDCINKMIQRPVHKIEDSTLLSDVVWSDPSHCSGMFDENPRGRGCLFNRDSVLNFLKAGSLTRMIRAHQCVNTGTLQNFGDKCITVFSASSYDQFMGNSSSILQLFLENDTIKATTFPPLYRLQKSETIYYKVQSLSDKNNHVCLTLRHPKLANSMSFKSPANKSQTGRSHRKSAVFKSDGQLPNSQVKSKLVRPNIAANMRMSFNYVRKPIVFDSGTNDYDESAVEYLPASVC